MAEPKPKSSKPRKTRKTRSKTEVAFDAIVNLGVSDLSRLASMLWGKELDTAEFLHIKLSNLIHEPPTMTANPVQSKTPADEEFEEAQ